MTHQEGFNDRLTNAAPHASHRRTVTRRRFIQGSAAAASAVWLVPGRGPCAAATDDKQSGPVIDCHAHLRHPSFPKYLDDDRRLIDAADKLGIDQLCCSILSPRRPATARDFQECNQCLAEGMRRYAGRVLGYCYVNPGYTREALAEVRRCVEERGFIGIKLYNEYTCNEPVVFPIVELAIELGVPILHHAGHAHYLMADQPRISGGEHLADLARRYPEARLICAHLGGGGDWEWEIKALRHAANVFLDTSGSVVDEGIVEMAVRVAGVDRVLFGCDNSMTAGMGKMRGAELSPADKQKVLGGNMQELLDARKTRR